MIYVLCIVSLSLIMSSSASNRPRRSVAKYAKIELGKADSASNRPRSSLVTYARSEFEEPEISLEGKSGVNYTVKALHQKKEDETRDKEEIKTKSKKSRKSHKSEIQEKRLMWVPGFLEEGMRILERQAAQRRREWEEKLQREKEWRELEEEGEKYRLASPTAIADRVVHNTEKVLELSSQDQFKHVPHYILDQCFKKGVLLAEKPLFKGYTGEVMGLYYLYFITHKNNKRFNPQERSLALVDSFDGWYLKIYIPSLVDSLDKKIEEEKRKELGSQYLN